MVWKKFDHHSENCGEGSNRWNGFEERIVNTVHDMIDYYDRTLWLTCSDIKLM